MNKPFLIFVEGSQGTGKSTVCRELRERLKYTTLLDLNAIEDKSEEAEDKMYHYHGRALEMFEGCIHLGMNFVVGRSYQSEKVYCNLGYKPYDFELFSHLLRQELDYLSKYYDIYFILLTATEEQLKERLKRDKAEYHKFSVENSLAQQEEYKKEMKILAEETKNIKVFEIENDNLSRTVSTIKDIILTGMIGE